MTVASPITITPTLAERKRVPIDLLVLAFPIIAVWISRSVMSFTDFAVVSQLEGHLGTLAQAAITPATFFLFCFIGFGMGATTAVNTFVAQNFGAGRKTDAAAFGWQGIYLSLILGVAFLPVYFLCVPFFTWVGHEPDVLAMEIVFTQIGVLGFAPSIAIFSLSAFFNGIHRPAIALVAGVAAMVFNALACYALVFGHFGFPAMGVAGSAWATLAGTLLQCAILVGWMLRPSMQREFHTLEKWRFNRKQFLSLLRVGLPAGVHFLGDILTWSLFCIVLVGSFGTAQLAASNLALRLLELSFMPAVGLGMALSSAVGKSIGEGRHDLAGLNVRWAAAIMLTYMTTVGLALFLTRDRLPLFFTEDPEVLKWTARVLICAAIYQIFDALYITYTSALRGAGDTAVPAVAGIVSSLVVLLAGGYAIAHYMPHWGIIGPWIAGALNVVVLGLYFLFRYRSGKWEKIDLMSAHADKPA